MQTVVNRKVWGWVSCEWELQRTKPDGSVAGSEIILPIRAVEYEDESSVEAAMGAGDAVYGVVDGAYVPGSMSLTLFAKYARQLMALATNDGEVPLSSVDFRLVVKKRERGSDEVIVDSIDFRIKKISDSHEQGGTDPLETVFECMPTLILRNGVRI